MALSIFNSRMFTRRSGLLRSISIGKRIAFILIALVIFIFGTVTIFVYGSLEIRDMTIASSDVLMLNGQKAKTMTTTRVISSALGELLRDVYDEEERIQLIRKAVDKFRYEDDNSGYVFVYEGTVNVAYPGFHAKQGKDLGHAKDKNDVYVIQELDKISREGGGFLEYVWAKQDKGDQPKISYAELIPGTDYWIGTGVYIDNIDHEKKIIADKINALVKSTTIFDVSILAGVLILIILPLSIFIIRSIIGPIRQATDAAESIASGNCEVVLDAIGRDEAAMLQSSLNSMASTLRKNMSEITQKTREAEDKAAAAEKALIEASEAREQGDIARKEGILQAANSIQEAVDSISTVMEQLSKQTEIIAQGTNVQRERIQDTATAMNEMNATVLEVARNASDAATLSNDSKIKAQDGAEIVGKSIEAMQTTITTSENLQNGMNRLEDQANAIGKVMTVITDIADQTNLLALNAAIEAARAGEAGRGFAVVADEVRKLAEKTMSATKEVGDSINAVQDVAKENISGMNNALGDLGRAVELTNESGEVLNQIVTGVDESAMQINSIATASEEQSAASEEINQGIEKINIISQETSASVEDSVRAITQLEEQMNGLQNVIESLRNG